jgi:hypothetical protein
LGGARGPFSAGPDGELLDVLHECEGHRPPKDDTEGIIAVEAARLAEADAKSGKPATFASALDAALGESARHRDFVGPDRQIATNPRVRRIWGRFRTLAAERGLKVSKTGAARAPIQTEAVSRGAPANARVYSGTVECAKGLYGTGSADALHSLLVDRLRLAAEAERLRAENAGLRRLGASGSSCSNYNSAAIALNGIVGQHTHGVYICMEERCAVGMRESINA